MHATELQHYWILLPKEDQFARLVLRRAVRKQHKSSRKQGRPLPEILRHESTRVSSKLFSSIVGHEVEDFRFNQSFFEDIAETIIGSLG